MSLLDSGSGGGGTTSGTSETTDDTETEDTSDSSIDDDQAVTETAGGRIAGSPTDVDKQRQTPERDLEARAGRDAPGGRVAGAPQEGGEEPATPQRDLEARAGEDAPGGGVAGAQEAIGQDSPGDGQPGDGQPSDDEQLSSEPIGRGAAAQRTRDVIADADGSKVREQVKGAIRDKAEALRDPVGVYDSAINRLPSGPGPTRMVGPAYIPDPSEYEELATEAAKGVSPHSGLSLDAEGMRARATREELFAQRAGRGVERLRSGRAPTKEQLGALVFQSAEIGELSLMDLGEETRGSLPLENVGPTVGSEKAGKQAENLIAGIPELAGQGVGAVGQFPTTAFADITGDAKVKRRELSAPGELDVPEQVSRDTTAGELEEEIAARNPGVEPEDVSVAGSATDGFDIEANIDRSDVRERIAADNEGVSPDDISFVETDSGDVRPVVYEVNEEGKTPTEAAGGARDVTERAATRTIEYFAERPIEAAAIVAPAGVRGFKGFESGLASKGVSTPPRPTIQRFKLGEASGATVGISRQRGKVGETQPLVTVARGTEGRTPVNVGTPEVSLTRAVGEGGQLSPELTAAETRTLVETLRREGFGSEATKVESFRETQARTQQSKLQPSEAEPVVRDVLESQEIPGEAASEVTGLLKEQGAQLYGSTVQRASAQEIGEPGISRTPRDIDVGGVKSATEFARQATERINKATDEQVVTREGSTVRSERTGEEIFDIHEAEDPGSGSMISGKPEDLYIFGTRSEPLVKTAEGVKTTTLSEQTARKGEGAMKTISGEPQTVEIPTGGELRGLIGPKHAGRVKDIPDFYLGETANIEALRRMGRTRQAEVAEMNLERFVEAFGDEIASRSRSELEAARAGETDAPKVELADFSDMGTARPSPGVASSPTYGGSAGGATTSPSPRRSPGSRSPSPGPRSPFNSSVFGTPSPIASSPLGDTTSPKSPAPSEGPDASVFDQVVSPGPSPGGDSVRSPGPSPSAGPDSPVPGPSPGPGDSPPPVPSPISDPNYSPDPPTYGLDEYEIYTPSPSPEAQPMPEPVLSVNDGPDEDEFESLLLGARDPDYTDFVDPLTGEVLKTKRSGGA